MGTHSRGVNRHRNRNAWRASLSPAWSSLHGHGVRRGHRGRLPAAWDHELHEWSRGRWLTWATTYGWSELKPLFVQWLVRRCGYANELECAVGVPLAPLRLSVGPQCLNPQAGAAVTCFHIFSDSEIASTICRGRSTPKNGVIVPAC